MAIKTRRRWCKTTFYLPLVLAQPHISLQDDGTPGQQPIQQTSLAELRVLEDSLIQNIRQLEPTYHLSVAEEDTEK